MSLPGAQNQSEPENATIKQMREAHEKAVADAKAEREAREALEIRLKAIEDEKLTADQKRDQEHLAALEENKTLKEQAEKARKYETEMQAIYDAELAQVPADKKELVQNLSSVGDPSDRLKALRSAVKLAGLGGVTMGATTDPARGNLPAGTSTETKPPAQTLDPKKPIPWSGEGGFFNKATDKKVLDQIEAQKIAAKAQQS